MKVTDADALRRMAEAAVEVGERRAALLGRVREALIAGDDSTALELMREYVGLTAVGT